MSAYSPIAAPCAWLGRDMVHSKRWIRDMPASAVAELDAALAAVKKKGLDWSQITRADFPLRRSTGCWPTSPTSWRTAAAS